MKDHIGMILGKSRWCGDSIGSIKRRIREIPPYRRTGPAPTYHSSAAFSDKDLVGVEVPHNDPLVIRLHIAGNIFDRVLIDTGATVNILSLEAMNRMNVVSKEIDATTKPIASLPGKRSIAAGVAVYPVALGVASSDVKFHVISEVSPFDAVMGAPWLSDLGAVPSTYHQCLKFPTPQGICTVRGNQWIARNCLLTRRKSEQINPVRLISEPNNNPSINVSNGTASANLDPSTFEPDQYEKVCIDESHPRRYVTIGSSISQEIRGKLVELLKENIATFAWSIGDMVGIDPSIISHKLNVDPTHKPVRQKKRKLGPERATAVNEEIDRLLKKGSITEVQYPEWLANPVVVKKKNGKWRICVDFTDLNKACPKDCFPLPDVERLVEATAGSELLSFMDAFSGYNQITMHPDDREKTAFITDRGTYCYRVMPFGLKNAGATYQRLVNRMFAEQLGSTMEVYIDDMLVKSQVASDHITHLKECFDILNQFGMKLNPEKCTFAVTSGEFLGYVVTKRGIEANPKQITAIMNLPSPRNSKEVQRLTGRIAALNRFISRSTDKCLPFYNLLKANKQFEWNEKCEEAFAELKRYLSTPPILAKPENGETLLLYVSVSESAVSGVLVREDRGEQRPIYYVSKSLLDAETRYPALEKLALAVVTAARKLRPYFQSHPIAVLTSQPLRTILHSPGQSGRLAKWAIELSEYDIEYRSRTSAKSQVLADFLTELAPEVVGFAPRNERWTLYVDGSASRLGAGIGIWLKSPTGEVLEQSFRLAFEASNNEAEYEALIAGLKLANELGAQYLQAYCDSQLVSNQFSGEFETKNDRMSAYLKIVRGLAGRFVEFKLTRVPRNENATADSLAALATASNPDLQRVIPVETIEKSSISPTINVSVVCTEVTEGLPEPLGNDHGDWRTPIVKYIQEGTVPVDKWAARRLKAVAARYLILDGSLFRRSANGLILHCIGKREANEVMAETHSREGGNHAGGRVLATKLRRLGYFWPTMVADCEGFAARCERCQRHAPIIHAPTETLMASVPPYPFMRWAMDVVGPMPKSTTGKRFLLVLTDYFTKWVEAKAYPSVQNEEVESFVWRNIVCRHGIPYEIVTDNGSQFISHRFEAFCQKYGIRLNKSTPRYPQGNGQAEATNKTIVDGIKKRLRGKKGRWSDELDGVLWSHRTTPRSASGQTPFSLSHGMEAMSPAEIRVPSLRRTLMTYNTEENDRKLKERNDELEELRDHALLRIQNYQQIASRYYNKKVRDRPLDEGDLVLRKVFSNTKEPNSGKLGPRWEGPYLIVTKVKPGVYRLKTIDGEEVPRAWNSCHLKRYHCADDP